MLLIGKEIIFLNDSFCLLYRASSFLSLWCYICCHSVRCFCSHILKCPYMIWLIFIDQIKMQILLSATTNAQNCQDKNGSRCFLIIIMSHKFFKVSFFHLLCIFIFLLLKYLSGLRLQYFYCYLCYFKNDWNKYYLFIHLLINYYLFTYLFSYLLLFSVE